MSGVGTTGAITGVGRVLKKKKPSVKMIAIELAEPPVLSSGKPGLHNETVSEEWLAKVPVKVPVKVPATLS